MARPIGGHDHSGQESPLPRASSLGLDSSLQGCLKHSFDVAGSQVQVHLEVRRGEEGKHGRKSGLGEGCKYDRESIDCANREGKGGNTASGEGGSRGCRASPPARPQH